jgi:hypothetical protein
MQRKLGRPIHVTYCTNVHAAESWDEMRANLESHALAIRDAVSPGEKFGIGLWLSDRASRELSVPANFAAFRDWLARENCYVFTLNAFPYGRFHRGPVKERVFAPDWTRPERLDYTIRCAEILARLLPAGSEGSTSTVPGSFKEWITTPDQRVAIVDHLADCAMALEKISLRRELDLHLALEPEPMGFLETADDLIEFFDAELRTRGAARLEEIHGLSSDESLAVINTRLGMCYDTCHMALKFENAADCIARLDRAGIRIGKYQISSALRCAPTPDALAQLARFDDGVYLHQVIARLPAGELHQYRDIAPALAARTELERASELRIHCHVPLDWQPEGPLFSTADHISDLLRAIAASNTVAHFEVETYTWDVLPPELRHGTLSQAVAGEIQWFLDRLATLEHPAEPASRR